jgi:hypothetical protein
MTKKHYCERPVGNVVAHREAKIALTILTMGHRPSRSKRIGRPSDKPVAPPVSARRLLGASQGARWQITKLVFRLLQRRSWKLPQFEPDYCERPNFSSERDAHIRKLLADFIGVHIRSIQWDGELTSMDRFIKNAMLAIARFEYRRGIEVNFDRGITKEALILNRLSEWFWTPVERLTCAKSASSKASPRPSSKASTRAGRHRSSRTRCSSSRPKGSAPRRLREPSASAAPRSTARSATLDRRSPAPRRRPPGRRSAPGLGPDLGRVSGGQSGPHLLVASISPFERK